MATPHPSWLASRTVHLVGGCRAFNGLDSTVEFYPKTVDGQTIRYQSNSYGNLYSELAGLEVAPIGFEFFSNSIEAKGLMPTDWRTYHPWTRKEVWSCNDQIDKWDQIAHGATKASDAVLWDLARRIAHQLRVCAWRLYQLSDAYRQQLRAKTAERKFETGIRFEDGFTWLGYLAVQVFLVDAGVLRDYLAEFFAIYVCEAAERPSQHVTTMASLKKHVLNKSQSVDPLFAQLKLATSAGGWIFLLGAYRDLYMHCVPLARAGARLLAVTTELPLKGVKSLASVSLPLPSDPSGISSARASPDRAARIAQELQLLTSASQGSVASVDALVYCYTALNSVVRLAAGLSARSPVEPEIPHLTEADIIGEVKIACV